MGSRRAAGQGDLRRFRRRVLPSVKPRGRKEPKVKTRKFSAAKKRAGSQKKEFEGRRRTIRPKVIERMRLRIGPPRARRMWT
jgi:hypothetical protein